MLSMLYRYILAYMQVINAGMRTIGALDADTKGRLVLLTTLSMTGPTELEYIKVDEPVVNKDASATIARKNKRSRKNKKTQGNIRRSSRKDGSSSGPSDQLLGLGKPRHHLRPFVSVGVWMGLFAFAWLHQRNYGDCNLC